MRVLSVYPVSSGRARLLTRQQRMRVLLRQISRLRYRQQIGGRRHRQQIRLIDQHGVRWRRYTRLLEAPRRLRKIQRRCREVNGGRDDVRRGAGLAVRRQMTRFLLHSCLPDQLPSPLRYLRLLAMKNYNNK